MTVMAIGGTAQSATLRHCRAALGDRVLRLQEEPMAILKGLYRLGSLVVTTFASGGRVSQSIRYPALTGSSPGLDCRGEQCRMRQELDVRQWRSVLAVLAPVADLPARSLLFFDDYGEPVQQMAVAPESGGLAFEELVCAMLHPDQQQLGCPLAVRAPHRPTGSLMDWERRWSQSDEDAFEELLRQVGDRRQVLYQAVRDKFACPIRSETVPSLLSLAAERATPLTVCTGNRGVRLCLSAPWSSPRWQQGQCHLAHNGTLISLDMGRVASVWRLRRPGPGRVLTALEALDSEGRWLWTLSSGGDEDAWLALLGEALIQEGRPGALFA
ncbi:putative hemin transport protein [Alloalcanivorax xenomutans]|nr:putative hemin transport protein [Alloalcanivorax xenomutans]